MKIRESFALAFQNIRTGKGRAFLTMLGIIIGISSVMVIIGIGSGMEVYMTDMFQSIGTNELNVSITGMGTTRKLSVEDMQEILEENQEHLREMSPTVSMSETVKVGAEQLDETAVSGVGEHYFGIKGIPSKRAAACIMRTSSTEPTSAWWEVILTMSGITAMLWEKRSVSAEEHSPLSGFWNRKTMRRMRAGRMMRFTYRIPSRPD